jgi:hypothetical protein
MEVRMLQDPDQPFEEWTAVVTAKSLGEAQTFCERIADTSDTPAIVLNVSQLTKTARNGKYKFVCWFKSEIPQ